MLTVLPFIYSMGERKKHSLETADCNYKVFSIRFFAYWKYFSKILIGLCNNILIWKRKYHLSNNASPSHQTTQFHVYLDYDISIHPSLLLKRRDTSILTFFLGLHTQNKLVGVLVRIGLRTHHTSNISLL